MDHRIDSRKRAPGLGLAALLLAVLSWAPLVQAVPAAQLESAASALETLAAHIEAGRLDAAAALADELPVARFAPAERLQAQQMSGYVHAHRGEYARALYHYALALEERDVLGNDLERRLRYTMAQLEFALGRFEAAVAQMQAWQALAAEVETFGPYILMGQAYFKVQDYGSALRSLEQGVRRAESQGAPLREDWLQLLHHLYVERRQWRDAVSVLERLSAMYPKPRYEQLLEEARAQQG